MGKEDINEVKINVKVDADEAILQLRVVRDLLQQISDLHQEIKGCKNE